MKNKSRSLRRANALSIALIAVGSLQMIGYLTGSKALRGIGAASAASPLPKVFGTAPVAGESGVELETFSSQFTLLYELHGETVEMPITPEIYSKVCGPYNRRNVYGAVLAYGPCLPPELVDQAMAYALEEPALLIAELKLPTAAKNFRVRVTGFAGDKNDHGEFRQRSWDIAPGKSSSY